MGAIALSTHIPPPPTVAALSAITFSRIVVPKDSLRYRPAPPVPVLAAIVLLRSWAAVIERKRPLPYGAALPTMTLSVIVGAGLMTYSPPP